MVNDLLSETSRRLDAQRPASVAEVRALPAPLVAMSDELIEANRDLKRFLFERMYRHYRVNRMTSKARRVVRDLFETYHREPDCLPTRWRAAADGAEDALRARLVTDYIAGMTDRYAIDEHRRLYDLYD